MAKILLIDDDTEILKVMRAFLERDHHEITTATNGLEGIRQLKTQLYDLIITDIIMPEQDGLEVIFWLKLNKQSYRQKVIAISGGSAAHDRKDLLHTCKVLSVDKVLPKPVDFGTLTSAVREVLTGVVENVQ